MNITVLGATGRTGTPLVAELLRRGHTLTALVRDPARLGPVAHRIRVVIGDSTDPEALGDALDGAEAVGFLVHIKECIEKPERLLFT